MANGNFVKIVTPIRTVKSDIGMMRIQLFNDQICLQFSPATSEKTSYGGIKYNGNPAIAPNVRFSIGVAASIAELIRKKIVPVADAKTMNGHWEIFACKRNNYESYLIFDVQNGVIVLTGIEVNNGQKKQASYSFPVTIISEGQNNPMNVQGEALAFADLMSEIGAGNEMPLHMRQYNQAVKDNIPSATGFAQQQPSTPTQPTQSIGSWRPQ